MQINKRKSQRHSGFAVASTCVSTRLVATLPASLVFEMLSLTIFTVDDVRTDSLVCGAGSGGQSGPWTAVSW